MRKFEDRTRLTLEEARALLELQSGRTRHIVSNEDGTYSVANHREGLACDYCLEEAMGITELTAKQDIRERIKSLACSEPPN